MILFLASVLCLIVSLVFLRRADRMLDEALDLNAKTLASGQKVLDNYGRMVQMRADMEARLERIKNGDLS